MEELFRFSVIRAATRSNAATVSLERPPVAPPAPAPSLCPCDTAGQACGRSASDPRFVGQHSYGRASVLASRPVQQGHPQRRRAFQDQLRDIVQSLAGEKHQPGDDLKRLEPIALDLFSIRRT